MESILLILIGILGGIIGGMGMGGGTITIPLLVLWGGVEQHLAQGINLIIFLPMAIITILIHSKNKLIEYKKALIIIIPAMITAILSSFLAQKIPSEKLKLYFGIFILILGFLQFFSIFFKKRNKKPKNIYYFKKKIKNNYFFNPKH